MADMDHQPQQPLSGERAIETVREIVTDANICLLVTRHDRFPFDARPMAAQAVGADGSIWFLSSSGSDKNRDIERDPRITLLAVHPETGHYWTTTNGKIAAGIKMLLSAAGAEVDDGGVHGELRI